MEVLAFAFGVLHLWHVSSLFENERHFSHLSDLEREMSFRTEMGMYYHYYKSIVESESFSDGMDKMINDNLSEYPNVLNARSKYNLGPEFAIGVTYRLGKYLNVLPKPVCWQIDRGEDLSSITSCEGIGVPVYFYLFWVWVHALATGYTVFLYSANLSGSIEGGLIAIASFFFNHKECTRVQWTPPLRESFGYPVLLVQMFSMAEILRKKKKPSFLVFLDMVIRINLCFLSWQFAQFVFLTQTIAMLILKWLRIISTEMYSFYCYSHLISLVLAIYLKQDTFLLYSLHLALLVTSACISKLCQYLTLYYSDYKIMTLLEIVSTVVCSKLWKSTFTNSSDKHIYDILKSKLSSYKDFHTMLYTCAVEFDFLQYETYETLIKTFLLPTAILAGFLILYYWYRNLRIHGFPNCIEPHVAYTVLQSGAFTIMAIFVMRLKLFMTPHLCILAGLACSKRYLEKLGIKKKITQATLIVLILALMSYNGIEQLQKERGFVGEYSNIYQEQLLDWIRLKTPKNAAFAGKMSIMANVMLSTKRPIVNNPYYESQEMRNRTMKVYEIFSRKSVIEIHDTLKNLKVDYLVLEKNNCFGYGNSKPGCKMIELWDLVDKGKAKSEGKIPVCPVLYRGNAHPFRRVFENPSYVVLQLNYTNFVEYKPNNIVYTSF